MSVLEKIGADRPVLIGYSVDRRREHHGGGDAAGFARAIVWLDPWPATRGPRTSLGASPAGGPERGARLHRPRGVPMRTERFLEEAARSGTSMPEPMGNLHAVSDPRGLHTRRRAEDGRRSGPRSTSGASSERPGPHAAARARGAEGGRRQRRVHRGQDACGRGPGDARDAWTIEEHPRGPNRSGTSSASTVTAPRSTPCWRRCCSRTSWGRRSGRPSWGPGVEGSVLQRHHAVVRDSLHRSRNEVDTAGDGFYATFDGPARAIRCALEIAERVRDLGIEIRAGIHTGECELIDGKVGGLAVSIGARVAANAGPSEVIGVADGGGPGRRLRTHVRGRRRARAEGRPRSVAPLPGAGVARFPRLISRPSPDET